jgi:hypothetical protein
MDNRDTFTTPVGICPSCGLTALDSPHASSDQCIRALEAEVTRLGELLEQVQERRARILAAPPGAGKR